MIKKKSYKRFILILSLRVSEQLRYLEKIQKIKTPLSNRHYIILF
jgi:hypothetical protein